jgi:hypothetical protein
MQEEHKDEMSREREADGAIAVRDEGCRSSGDRALDGILIRGAIALKPLAYMKYFNVCYKFHA